MTKNKLILLIIEILLVVLIGAYWIVKKEKSTIPFGFSDEAVVYTISSSGEYPKFLKAVIDSEDVKPGDTQKILIEAESPDGIKEIKAEIKHNRGIIDELVLTLKDGNEKHGQWFGEWEVHSTHSEAYGTTFIAEDNIGKTNKIVLAWTNTCVIPRGGDWTLDSNCSISGVNGVDNGNFTVNGGYTLTINNRATFAWNPGKTITIIDGNIAVANGGQLKQTNLWMIDEDADNHPISSVKYAQDVAPEGGRRMYLVTETQIDCCDIDHTVSPSSGFFPWENKCGNFDYNCDGIEERFCAVKTNITNYSDDCVRVEDVGYVVSGWKKEIPNCGERATYISCYRFEVSNCVGGELHRPTYAEAICGQRCDFDVMGYAMPYAKIVEDEMTMLCR